MSRAQGNLLAQINGISGTQEMGWQRICLLESALSPFMPEAGLSLIKLSRWFVCMFYIFLVLISSCNSDLELGRAGFKLWVSRVCQHGLGQVIHFPVLNVSLWTGDKCYCLTPGDQEGVLRTRYLKQK